MTPHRLRIALVLTLLALVTAASATAAAPPRPVLIGFQDESSFLWGPSRLLLFELASETHAGVIRVIANWSQIAATRPSSPADQADPAYQFQGLDDLV